VARAEWGESRGWGGRDCGRAWRVRVGEEQLAASLLRLLPGNGRIVGGEILLDGADVVRMGTVELRRVRGGRASIVFQEPSLALHPTMQIGAQICEVLRAHGTLNKSKQRERAREILRLRCLNGAQLAVREK